jgi:uncharacterized membrane protein HdeD (DUF308 family)
VSHDAKAARKRDGRHFGGHLHTTTLLLDIENLRPRWGWLLTLGTVLVLIGTTAMIIPLGATIAGSLIFGWILSAAGIVEIIYAFRIHKWGGLFLHLMVGLLGLFTGLLTLTHPLAGSLVWTLLIASFMVVVGVFRLIAAITLRFPNWGWSVLDGVITMILGALLWGEWPWSSLWFWGVALGISLIFRGWSYIMFAIAIREVPKATELRPAA